MSFVVSTLHFCRCRGRTICLRAKFFCYEPGCRRIEKLRTCYHLAVYDRKIIFWKTILVLLPLLELCFRRSRVVNSQSDFTLKMEASQRQLYVTLATVSRILAYPHRMDSADDGCCHQANENVKLLTITATCCRWK